MSVFDFLRADICEVEDCGNEAFRKCISGCGWRCAEHPCIHMANDEGSWLSTDAVVSRMTDKELSEARLRLSLQIAAIDNEISYRRLKQVKFQPPMPDKESIAKTKRLLDKFLDTLSPQQKKALEKKLENSNEDN